MRKLKLRWGIWLSREIEAFVVQTICTPIRIQENDIAKEHFTQFREIELADGDHGNKDLEIDMLIGADFMWLFFTERRDGGRAAKDLWRAVQPWDGYYRVQSPVRRKKRDFQAPILSPHTC